MPDIGDPPLVARAADRDRVALSGDGAGAKGDGILCAIDNARTRTDSSTVGGSGGHIGTLAHGGGTRRSCCRAVPHRDRTFSAGHGVAARSHRADAGCRGICRRDRRIGLEVPGATGIDVLDGDVGRVQLTHVDRVGVIDTGSDVGDPALQVRVAYRDGILDIGNGAISQRYAALGSCAGGVTQCDAVLSARGGVAAHGQRSISRRLGTGPESGAVQAG
ncbi:hypothetical protein D3C78_1209170 [compost metagenome]